MVANETTPVAVTRFTNPSGWVWVEAESGRILLHASLLLQTREVDGLIEHLRLAAQIAGLS